nr:hypothetical protein [Bradyrhizobium erythrophlei]
MSPEQSGGPAFCKARSPRFSVREVDDEFGVALSRDLLRDPFGGFSGGVVIEFLSNVGAYDPVAEVVARNNVNSKGCHRLSSAERDDWRRIKDGTVMSVSFSAIEKSEEADGRQWGSAPCAARWRPRIHKP